MRQYLPKEYIDGIQRYMNALRDVQAMNNVCMTTYDEKLVEHMIAADAAFYVYDIIDKETYLRIQKEIQRFANAFARSTKFGK